MADLRTLVIVLGDQLTRRRSTTSTASVTRVWMTQVAEESAHVRSSKQRIAAFIGAMRHLADELRRVGAPLDHARLGEDSAASLAASLRNAIGELKPQRPRPLVS